MALGQKIRSARDVFRFVSAVLVTLAALTTVPPASAQAADDKAEARERFHRGLRLFEQGDDAGALAEFQRAYDLTRHPLLSFNIGLVYAAMKRPVEAVDTLDRLLAAPGDLDAAKLERARRTRAEQAASIGSISITSNVSGATIEIDGVARGKTPLAQPIRVARGSHIVAVVAPGHIPVRRELLVASGGVSKLAVELERADGRLAELEIPVSLPGVEIRVDGERVGTTPLSAPITLAPGKHAVSLIRPGYRSLHRDVQIGAGARGRLDAKLDVDASTLGREGGTLVIEVSEPNATIWLDGNPIQTTARVPHGEHVLAVERAGFLRTERSVVVARGTTTRVEIELEPTPETRAAYVGRTTSQRTWGWVALGGGALIAAGSTGFLIYNMSAESDASDDYDAAAAEHEPGGSCDPGQGLQTDECRVRLELALDDLTSIRDREKFGWIGLGTGAVAAAFGAYLLLSNDDPDRYEPGPESEAIARVRAVPVGFATPGGFGLGVVGSF